MLDGIDAAVEAGLGPVKVNAVVKRGVNDHGIEALAERFRGTGVILRFIEFMDVGSTNGWRLDDVVPAQEIVDRIGASWPLEPVDRVSPGDVATRWRYRDGGGEIGVIASVTQPFCGACTRARISAEGQALHVPVRGRRPRPARAAALRGRRRRRWTSGSARIWSRRTDRYSDLRTAETTSRPKVEMSHIGG